MWWLLLVACARKASFDTPIPVDDAFPRVDAAPDDLARYEQAAAWSDDRSGLALLIVHGGDVVFEHYAPGYSADQPVHLFSGTKTFSCAIAMTAVEDGTLSLDEPASDTITEWQGDDRAQITVRQLLQFTSGLHESWWKLTRDGLLKNPRVADKYAVAVGEPLDQPPGTEFHYGSQHLMAFGEVMRRKLDRDPGEWVTERVLDPIGMRFGGWIHDPDGNSALPYGAFTTANEWAKFGVLLRDDGMWKGTAILPAGALSQCEHGSDANPAYGLAMWLNREVPDGVDLSAFDTLDDRHGGLLLNDGPADLFAAAGYNDNRLYVIPSLDLVIVRLGTGSRRFKDAELLSQILGP